MTLASEFYDLFRGREDCLFLDDGNGPPRQVKEEEWDFMKFPLTSDAGPSHTSRHLWPQGPVGAVGPAIGIYPLVEGTDCRWICSDFDDENALEYAIKMHQQWSSYGITSWIATSKSKGYHVWVFIADWCSGTIARRAALWVHQVADVPALEVNPKQEITDGYGNCVRLPYWHGRDKGRMTAYKIESSRGARGVTLAYDLEEFIKRASTSKATVAELKKLAVKYVPPEQRVRIEGDRYDIDRDYTGEVTDLPCRDVYKGNRGIEVGNRDNMLWAVAKYMRGINLDEDEAYAVMEDIWDSQMENPSGNVLPLRVALDKVRRAYAFRG